MGMNEQVEAAEKVRSEQRDNVLIITIENPPSGALTGDVRSRLFELVETAEADGSVKAIVLTGSEGMFATGAGLSETIADDTPTLAALCDRIEACQKPVVAAIGGPALGGGLEIALAAHMRISTPAARLGAPDITLGVLPNAGGTQRLPKVIGGVAALKLLLSGRAVSGDVARKVGLVDVLEVTDLMAAATSHGAQLAESGAELKRSSVRRDRLGEGTSFLEAVAEHRRAAEASPLDAPSRMIECVEAALLLPYDIGRGMEEAAFDDLVDSEHSKSLRHIFAAERRLQATTRWEGRTASRTIDKVAVISAQGLGAELVVQCLDTGFEVVVADANDEALEAGVGRVIGHYDARVANKVMSEDDVEDLLDRMQAASGYGNLMDVDIVIDPSQVLTKERLATLDASMKAGALLMVGGERVPMSKVASMTSRAADVVGLRFYPGMKKNRLVEMSVDENTSAAAVATARAFARKIDRLILEVTPSKEAIGTRLLEALHAACDLCLEEGAGVEQIDLALKDWGVPFGSFSHRDMLGIRRVNSRSGSEGERGGGIDEVLVATGRLGLSVGRGYYLYRERGKPGIEDPEVEQMIAADRDAKGIKPRRVTDAEVRFRALSAMAGAGAQLLLDGVAKRPADIDMAAVHGLGFARRTGGVMFAADLLGLEEVRRHLLEMSTLSARIPSPPSMIQDLIRAEQDFSSLNA